MRAAEHYVGQPGREYHYQKRGVPAEAAPWIARSRAQKFAPWIGENDEVLEIGVGAGWNLAAVRCHRKVGVDPAEFLAAEVARLDIEFHTGTEALAPACFDVVLCHHVLEHAPDPLALLGEARRLLKTHGRLIVHVPYEKELRYRQFDPAEPNHHLFSWNVQTLGNLVVEARFRIEQIGLGRYGYDRFAAAWAVKLRMGERGYRLLRGLAVTLRPLREILTVGEPA